MKKKIIILSSAFVSVALVITVIFLGVNKNQNIEKEYRNILNKNVTTNFKIIVVEQKNLFPFILNFQKKKAEEKLISQMGINIEIIPAENYEIAFQKLENQEGNILLIRDQLFPLMLKEKKLRKSVCFYQLFSQTENYALTSDYQQTHADFMSKKVVLPEDSSLEYNYRLLFDLLNAQNIVSLETNIKYADENNSSQYGLKKTFNVNDQSKIILKTQANFLLVAQQDFYRQNQENLQIFVKFLALVASEQKEYTKFLEKNKIVTNVNFLTFYDNLQSFSCFKKQHGFSTFEKIDYYSQIWENKYPELKNLLVAANVSEQVLYQLRYHKDLRRIKYVRSQQHQQPANKKNSYLVSSGSLISFSENGLDLKSLKILNQIIKKVSYLANCQIVIFYTEPERNSEYFKKKKLYLQAISQTKNVLKKKAFLKEQDFTVMRREYSEKINLSDLQIKTEELMIFICQSN